MALSKETKLLRKKCKGIIAAEPLKRAVKSVLDKVKEERGFARGYMIQKGVIELLMAVISDWLTEIYEDCNVVAACSKRNTILDRDFYAVAWIRSRYETAFRDYIYKEQIERIGDAEVNYKE